MPVLMRGGGGGKKTKDATALPEDVRSGKTFYGKDGKQTGIWTPKVIDFTGDATAVPSDVAKGKVFYNNDGKQVGTCVDLPLIFSQQITIKGGLEKHEEGQFGLNGVKFGIYTYRNFNMYSFASSFGFLSRRHGFLKIPVSNINKILIRDKKGNSIPIYLKENNTCGSFKLDMNSSYVTEVRIDYDYQAKELSWFCTQDSPSMGAFENNLLLDVLVY